MFPFRFSVFARYFQLSIKSPLDFVLIKTLDIRSKTHFSLWISVNLGATLCRKRTVSQRNTEAAQGNTEKKTRVELIGRISREPVEKCRHKATEEICFFSCFSSFLGVLLLIRFSSKLLGVCGWWVSGRVSSLPRRRATYGMHCLGNYKVSLTDTPRLRTETYPDHGRQF
jgi:hypothetical protein